MHIHSIPCVKHVAPLLSILLISACRTSAEPASQTPEPDYAVRAKITTAIPPQVQVHNPSNSNPLTAHPWHLKQATDRNGQRIDVLFVDDNRPLTLEFRHEHVRISNTCNPMSGTYTLDSANNALNISALVGTMMACPQPIMALDAAIAQRLEGALQMSIEGNELRIQNEVGDVLVFRE